MNEETIVDPVKAKIEKIRAGGEEAYKNGKVKFFNGFPQELNQRMNICFTGWLQNMSVLWEMHKIFQRYDVIVKSVEIDFPFHVTIMEASMEEGHSFLSGSDHRKLKTKVERLFLEAVVCDQYIRFKRLVADANGAVILLSEEIPDWILNTRKAVSELYISFGLIPKPIDNILHSTIFRLYDPHVHCAHFDQEALYNLYMYMMSFTKLRKFYNTSLLIGDVRIGTAMDLQNWK